MIVETSMNVAPETIRALDEAAQTAGTTRSAMLVLVMKKLLERKKMSGNAFARVKYQKRGGIWKRMHVSLEGRDYEYFLDMRKGFKFSVSFFVSLAVREYLEELLADIISNGNKIPDNYLFQEYIFFHDNESPVTCWIFYWGIPGKLKKLFT